MASKTSSTVLVISVAAAFFVGAAAVYLLSFVFPGTFISFRSSVTPTTSSTVTTPVSSTTQGTSGAAQPFVITNQPATPVTMQDVQLTNSRSGGSLTFDLTGLKLGELFIAQTGVLTGLDESFVEGFSVPPTQAEVDSLLGASIAALNARGQAELGVSQVVLGPDFIDSLMNGPSQAAGGSFMKRLDDLLGGPGRGAAFLFGILGGILGGLI